MAPEPSIELPAGKISTSYRLRLSVTQRSKKAIGPFLSGDGLIERPLQSRHRGDVERSDVGADCCGGGSWVRLPESLTLAVLHPQPAERPAVAGEPVQDAADMKPFEHVAGGKLHRIVPRFRWDESARVMSEEPCTGSPRVRCEQADLRTSGSPSS